MCYRRIDPNIKRLYLSSYVSAQEKIKSKAARASLNRSTRSFHGIPPHTRVKFGDWHINPREIYKNRKLDEKISQVWQKPMEEVPKSLFMNVPHVQKILSQSRALNNAETLINMQVESKSKALKNSGELIRKKHSLFEKIFTEVMPTYRSFVIAEFIRQEPTWIAALEICRERIWKHPHYQNHQWKKDHELPADICLSKCPKGDTQSFFACYRSILNCRKSVSRNTLLRGLIRSSIYPGRFWDTALRILSNIPHVVKCGTMKKISSKETSGRKLLHLAETFALVIENLGRERQANVMDVMNFIDDFYPEIRRVSSIWTAYFNSHACAWEECMKVYNTNLPVFRVNCDTLLFNALIQRCVSAKALSMARELYKVMQSKGIPETFLESQKGDLMLDRGLKTHINS